MKLPNNKNAYIPEAKLKDYLLNRDHPEGGSKARFLHGLGYAQSKLETFRKDLLEIAQSADVTASSKRRNVTLYVVEGLLKGPAGVSARFKTVWQVSNDDDRPRFVTGYPARRKRNNDK